MDFQKQKPIYLQIADRLMEQILAGVDDDRMPSVREVAAAMGVNPNTVVRSFDHLQNAEIIYQRRGVGYFVSADARQRILAAQRREFFEDDLPAIRQRLKALDISTDELLNHLQQ
ncbi:MAG: GntR family transcriptional regulator [Bacteroidales bacterium]|nr:GntR family transcriptional regulator [Bacteroidales bacterium]